MGMLFVLIFSSMLGWLPPGGAVPDLWLTGGWPVSHKINCTVADSSITINLSINGEGLLDLISGFLRHLTLPLLTLTLFQYGGFLLLTRATMIEALTEDYIVTARAKGLKEREVLLKHALKNASLPLITSTALSFAFIISGAIITETVFRYPGMGGWIWEAISFYDYGVLMPIFYILALCVIVANLIADLLYGIIDPRIRYG
jgi:peptide/nickel transport system permease protein